MKAGLAVGTIKNTIDGLFPLKTFCLSLALLIFLLIGTVGIYQMFFAPSAEPVALTGKTIAMLDVAQKIEDEPIQTKPEDIPDHHAASNPTDHEPSETVEKVEETPEATTSVEDSIAGLSEQSPSGHLPIIRASDNLKSFDAYKAPFKLKPDTKGVISLVMGDYGLSDNLSKVALENLPAATTLIASPYSTNLQPKITGARTKGMEVWMALPIQGTNNSAPSNMGPNAILAGLNSKENMSRLNAQMGRATGYVGMAITVTPSFDKSSPELRSVINALSARGLGITQLVPNDDFISMIAAQTNTPYINGDIWIDTILTKADILNALAIAEKAALENGHAVASFNPSLLVTTTIAEWQKSLADKNIQIAPLTYTTRLAINTPHKSAASVEQPAEKVAEKPEPPKTETAPHGTKQ